MMSTAEIEPDDAAGSVRAPTFETARGGERWALPCYTADQVRALPATVDYVDVARAFNLSKDGADAAVAAGTFPVKPIMLGSRIRRFLRSELLAVLGIPEIPGGEMPARQA
jgi:predicted DNA-binding transcriptional regulator AlpA